MDLKDYWKNKHAKYATQEWTYRPSIFATYAIKYFPENGKLLDLGAGQGQDSIFFAKNGYKVTSTDFSPEALQKAMKKAKAEEVKIDFLELDLTNQLPFGKEKFETVYSSLALHYFDEETTKNLFKDIARVLKTNGVLACLLNTIDDPEVRESQMIEEGLYKTSSGLVKRYFNLKYLHQITDQYFETVIADNHGETYKDEIKTLVRFIGRKK